MPAAAKLPEDVTVLPRPRRREIPQPTAAFAPSETKVVGALVAYLSIALAVGAVIVAMALAL